jgi:hypothetical protein
VVEVYQNTFNSKRGPIRISREQLAGAFESAWIGTGRDSAHRFADRLSSDAGFMHSAYPDTRFVASLGLLTGLPN